MGDIKVFFCKLLRLHKPYWKYGDGIKIQYCDSCKVVTEVSEL